MHRVDLGLGPAGLIVGAVGGILSLLSTSTTYVSDLVLGNTPDVLPTWIRLAAVLGLMTGAFYALAKRAVSFGVDRLIRNWETLETNQTKMHEILQRLQSDFHTHLRIEEEWQRGIERRLSLLESRAFNGNGGGA